MTKQDILDQLEFIDYKTRCLQGGSIESQSAILAEIVSLLEKVRKCLDGMVEYRPGDKAILQAVISDMPTHPHVDDTVSRRALIRLVGEMGD